MDAKEIDQRVLAAAEKLFAEAEAAGFAPAANVKSISDETGITPAFVRAALGHLHASGKIGFTRKYGRGGGVAAPDQQRLHEPSQVVTENRMARVDPTLKPGRVKVTLEKELSPEESLREQVRELEGEVARLTAELERVKESRQHITERRKVAQRGLTDTAAALRAAKARIAQLERAEQALEAAQLRIGELEAKLAQLQQMPEELARQITDLTS